MVMAAWRLARLRHIETGLFNLRLCDLAAELNRKYTPVPENGREAFVFRDDTINSRAVPRQTNLPPAPQCRRVPVSPRRRPSPSGEGALMIGTVYTETVVYLAPEAFANDVPYQVAIVTLEDGTRVTGRVIGERAVIDDRVEQVELRDGVPYFRRVA